MALHIQREPQDTAAKILELNLAIMQHETKLKALRQVRRKYMRIMKRIGKAAKIDPVFENCNVCGRRLADYAEHQMGMCASCASE